VWDRLTESVLNITHSDLDHIHELDSQDAQNESCTLREHWPKVGPGRWREVGLWEVGTSVCVVGHSEIGRHGRTSGRFGIPVPKSPFKILFPQQSASWSSRPAPDNPRTLSSQQRPPHDHARDRKVDHQPRHVHQRRDERRGRARRVGPRRTRLGKLGTAARNLPVSIPSESARAGFAAEYSVNLQRERMVDRHQSEMLPCVANQGL
jgi:hypothetical protein